MQVDRAPSIGCDHRFAPQLQDFMRTMEPQSDMSGAFGESRKA